MTTIPRAATSPELALLRSDNQSSRVYVTVHQPTTVYSARLAAVPASTDQITSITYNSGSGTHTNILADQTLYVGTSTGAYDLGMCRIRNLTGIGATTGTFNIAEESEIAWASGAYLTVKDEFAIWPRHIRLDGTTPYMDYDVAYTDQNSKCESIPIMGPHRVLWLENGATSVSVTLDSADSWVLNNTITGVLWAAPTASATSGLTTNTPTLTFNSYGVHRVSLTITNSDSAVFTGYRYIFVVKASESATGSLSSDYILSSNFTIDSLSGDYESGGWTAQITMYDGATRTDIRDRALVIIHTRDTYGASGSSVGFIAGAQNILFEGWIAGETIRRAPDDLYSAVSFTIEGPQYWLNRIPAFPVGLKDRTTAPTKWTRFLGLTAKATVWHMLHWRTTITRCTDVFPLTNAWRAARIEAPGAQTLWEQLKTIESTTVLADPCGDRYGRLHNQVNQQLLDDTARGAIPTVMTLTGDDISGDVEIERNTVDNASIVDLSGFSYDGTTGTPFFSLSPGRVFRNYGSAPEVVDRLVLYDQATTNTLCGRYSGWRNNEYPRVSMLLASNHRFIDAAPYSFYSYVVATADTPRGIAQTLKLIPRRVSFEYNNQGGYFLTRAEFEAEAVADLAITGDTPTIVPEEPPLPPPPPEPPPPPIVSTEAKVLWMFHSNASSTPPVAVIYEILDDYNAPVYTALIPPSSLHIDEIFGGYYSPTYDRLMIVGHASSTPVIPGSPGWAGGESRVTIYVDAPLSASPVWSLKGINGVTIITPSPFTAQCSFGFAGFGYGDVTLNSSGSMYWSGSALGSNYIAACAPSGDSPGFPYGCFSALGKLSGGALAISPQGFTAQAGYRVIGSTLTVSYVGPMPDDLDTSAPFGSTYYSNPGAGTTHDYITPGIEVGATPNTYFYGARFVRASGAFEFIRISATWTGFPNGSNASYTVVHTADETAAATRNIYWTNTFTPSEYATAVLYTGGIGYPYLYLNGVWSKSDITLNQGFCHFTARSGSNAVLYVEHRAVTSGNVPAKYTADISDVTGNPFIDMTGNMWSLITSGNLDIRHSFLTF